MWQEKAEQNGRLEQQKRPHLLTIERTKSRLTQEQSALQKQQGEAAEAQQERVTVENSVKAAKAQVVELTATLAGLKSQETAYQAAREARQALVSQRRFWEKELGQLRTRQQAMDKLEGEKTAVFQTIEQAAQRLVAVEAQLDEAKQAQQRKEAALATQKQLEGEQLHLREEMNQLKTERIEPLEQQEGVSARSVDRR